jgi:hypothetical protein
LPIFRCFNVFDELHATYFGDGVLACLRVGRRTSAQRKPVESPVALKRNFAVRLRELICVSWGEHAVCAPP